MTQLTSHSQEVKISRPSRLRNDQISPVEPAPGLLRGPECSSELLDELFHILVITGPYIM